MGELGEDKELGRTVAYDRRRWVQRVNLLLVAHHLVTALLQVLVQDGVLGNHESIAVLLTVA